MHTLIITGSGIALLGIFLLLARFWTSDPGIFAVVAKAFLLVWLTITIINLWIGVAHAGYTVMQELPILLVTFGIPAALAFLVIRRYAAS